MYKNEQYRHPILFGQNNEDLEYEAIDFESTSFLFIQLCHHPYIITLSVELHILDSI